MCLAANPESHVGVDLNGGAKPAPFAPPLNFSLIQGAETPGFAPPSMLRVGLDCFSAGNSEIQKQIWRNSSSRWGVFEEETVNWGGSSAKRACFEEELLKRGNPD